MLAESSISEALNLALTELSERCLYFAANWTANLLESIDPTRTVSAQVSNIKYMKAKTCFDLRQYERVVWLLRDDEDQKSLFLRLYAEFLQGERKKHDCGGFLSKTQTIQENQNLEEIETQLLELLQAHRCDTYLLYLYGVVLRQLNKKEKAKRILWESLRLSAINWSAWKELEELCDFDEALEMAQKLLAENSSQVTELMVASFLARASVESKDPSLVFHKYYKPLEALAPQSQFVKQLKAVFLYNTRDYDEAETVFEDLFENDPSLLDNVDLYSNILFVKEDRTRLSQLAKNCVNVDRYRPETCCVVGNYYALREEHEKAVIYFKRALALDKNYLSAYTLMGHEYLELGNTNAALECYRRAIDLNDRDYRAWFGLGQTYEMLSLHYYALNYYQRATLLRPLDARMWQALGSLYETLDRKNDALKCFSRVKSLEPVT